MSILGKKFLIVLHLIASNFIKEFFAINADWVVDEYVLVEIIVVFNHNWHEFFTSRKQPRGSAIQMSFSIGRLLLRRLVSVLENQLDSRMLLMTLSWE